MFSILAIQLIAENREQERIRQYLEEYASETLAEKINSGVVIEQDGKQLRNRKTLSGFMTWACEEAKKQAAKGANAACIDDATVFGWAIHYFEEDSIIGTLYTEDGAKYKPAKPKKTSAPITNTPKPKAPVAQNLNGQQSFFDALDIIDAYGMYDKLWQFSSYLVSRGYRILEASPKERFEDGNIEPMKSPDPANFYIRATNKGRPIEEMLNGQRVVHVKDRYYIPEKEYIT